MKQDKFLLKKRIVEIEKKLMQSEHEYVYNNEASLLFNEKQTLQRNLSLIEGEETAVPFDFPYLWDVGAPLPHVISDGCKTFLIYYINEHSPEWEKKQNIPELGTASNITALVEFIHCYSYKFGGINDEVICGHPLYEHGLNAYNVHLIENSIWLKEESKTNSIHSNYDPKWWEQYKHYIFTFHDEIFECIANDYTVEVFKGSIYDVYLHASEKLFKYNE